MLKVLICIFLMFLLYSVIVFATPVEITIEYPTTTCSENWQCPDWSTVSCISGTQTRTCIDQNSCGTTVNKPEETLGCTSGSGSTGSGSGGSTGGSTPIKVGNKTTTQPTPSVPEVPGLKQSDFLSMEMIAPESAESGEPILVVVNLTSLEALNTTVELLEEKQDVSLQTGESKSLSFIVFTPETGGDYNLVAVTPYATANKTINLNYKPLFLYVTPVGNQTYEIHLKSFENDSTTELEVVRDNKETVFVDALSNEVDYRVNLTLTPADYIVKAKLVSESGIIDEDTRTLKVEGNPVFNYGIIILIAVVIVILVASIILFRVKR